MTQYQPDSLEREALDSKAQDSKAHCQIGPGKVWVEKKCWDGPIDVQGTGKSHHLQLSLLPNSINARGCFMDHWSPHRFEPFGQVFFLPAQQTVRAISDCRKQISIVCSFEPEVVEQWLEQDIDWEKCRLENALDVANTRIRSLLFQIGEELRTPSFAGEAMIELMVAQTSIELSRYLMGLEEETLMGGLPAWRLRLIEQRLAEDSIPPSLTELAELCRLSVRHLSRAFKVSRGRSIGSYIAEHRINHAKRLLASGMSVKAVAYQTGFSAPSNFSAAFLRATGESPKQFRLRVTGKPLRAVADMH